MMIKVEYPLKYFCPKCHIWWEINNTNFLFGVYRSVRVLFICSYCIDVMQNVFLVFVTVFSWTKPDGRSFSNFYRLVSLCTQCITLSAYTASNCFIREKKKQFCIKCAFNNNLSFIYRIQLCRIIFKHRSKWSRVPQFFHTRRFLWEGKTFYFDLPWEQN